MLPLTVIFITQLFVLLNSSVAIYSTTWIPTGSNPGCSDCVTVVFPFELSYIKGSSHCTQLELSSFVKILILNSGGSIQFSIIGGDTSITVIVKLHDALFLKASTAT